MGRTSASANAASATSTPAADFKKLSKSDKITHLPGQDIWPVESIGMGKANNEVFVVTAVHGPSQETVIGTPLNDAVLQSHAMWWHMFIGDATDIQRSYVQTHVGKDAPVWSRHTLMVDVKKALDQLKDLDASGVWQSSIVAEINDDGLQTTMPNLLSDAFITTLDGSNPKISPVSDLARLWYAACNLMGKALGKPHAVKLKSDDTKAAGMGKVLRLCPLLSADMNNNVKNFRKSKSMAATLTLPDALSALGKEFDMDWNILMGKRLLRRGRTSIGLWRKSSTWTSLHFQTSSRYQERLSGYRR